jgi:hypothetical protein
MTTPAAATAPWPDDGLRTLTLFERRLNFVLVTGNPPDLD